jgi:hypothetical protein
MRWKLSREAALAVLGLAVLFVAAQAHAAGITVGSGTGPAGGTVNIDIVLAVSQGEMVAGTQNDITFDDAMANLAMARDCVINPAISDDEDVNPTCEDDPPVGPCKSLERNLTDVEDGRRFRGLILALGNTNAIPATTLYTCTFTIAAGVANGTVIPLAASNCGASDPAGGALETACTSGMITVGEVTPPTDTPAPVTNTPVRTNTPTEGVTGPTNTPTRAGNTPTRTRGDGELERDEDDDGCQVVATSSQSGWLILLPAAMFLWMRRRGR